MPLLLAGMLSVFWVAGLATGVQGGIFPRSNGFDLPWWVTGWQMVTFHLGHASAGHLLSNLVGLVALGTLANFFFPRASRRAWPLIWVGSGVCLWLIGGKGMHMGASALVYGLFHLVFWLGVFRHDRRSIVAMFIAVLCFGQFFLAFWPAQGVSWEGHVSGALMGLLAAWLWRRADAMPAPKVWEDEPEESQEPELLPLPLPQTTWGIAYPPIPLSDPESPRPVLPPRPD